MWVNWMLVLLLMLMLFDEMRFGLRANGEWWIYVYAQNASTAPPRFHFISLTPFSRYRCSECAFAFLRSSASPSLSLSLSPALSLHFSFNDSPTAVIPYLCSADLCRKHAVELYQIQTCLGTIRRICISKHVLNSQIIIHFVAIVLYKIRDLYLNRLYNCFQFIVRLFSANGMLNGHLIWMRNSYNEIDIFRSMLSMISNSCCLANCEHLFQNAIKIYSVCAANYIHY